jgi:hypothetical protein
MERSASVANIKCVNSNLLGIYDFRLPHYALIGSDPSTISGDACRVIANDCVISREIAKDDRSRARVIPQGVSRSPAASSK